MKRHARLGTLALVILLAAPTAAWACPACLVTSEESRVAFAQTAIALTLLPLGMVGGVGMWLRSRARDHTESDEEVLSTTGVPELPEGQGVSARKS